MPDVATGRAAQAAMVAVSFVRALARASATVSIVIGLSPSRAHTGSGRASPGHPTSALSTAAALSAVAALSVSSQTIVAVSVFWRLGFSIDVAAPT